MESFLGIDWKIYGNCSELVPEAFVLGPFIQGLNDPVHHKDFGKLLSCLASCRLCVTELYLVSFFSFMGYFVIHEFNLLFKWY